MSRITRYARIMYGGGRASGTGIYAQVAPFDMLFLDLSRFPYFSIHWVPCELRLFFMARGRIKLSGGYAPLHAVVILLLIQISLAPWLRFVADVPAPRPPTSTRSDQLLAINTGYDQSSLKWIQWQAKAEDEGAQQWGGRRQPRHRPVRRTRRATANLVAHKS